MYRADGGSAFGEPLTSRTWHVREPRRVQPVSDLTAEGSSHGADVPKAAIAVVRAQPPDAGPAAGVGERHRHAVERDTET